MIMRFTNKRVQYISLGEIDYEAALVYQTKLFDETLRIKLANRKVDDDRQIMTSNYLIFCYHPHVYTLGRTGQESNLLLDSSEMVRREVQFYRANRGGDITYHGPGQIVCYPILDLHNFFTDIHKYMRLLEEAVIRTLRLYGIEAGRIKGLTGVWLEGDALSGDRKICALGVKCSRWVTMHGLALNVNTDLTYFQGIIPCGIEDREVTSMQAELGRPVNLEEVEVHLRNNLVQLFEMELE